MVVSLVFLKPWPRGIRKRNLLTRLDQRGDSSTFVSVTESLSLKVISWWLHINLIEHRWWSVWSVIMWWSDLRPFRNLWCRATMSQWSSPPINWLCLNRCLDCLFKSWFGTTLSLARPFVIPSINYKIIIFHSFLIKQAKLRWEVHFQEQ